MQYALLTYQAHPEYNVGDYIQSLAAAQFLPQINKYICREKLSQYNDENVKMILNGWFMHRPDNWPPSGKINPLLISFHLNSQAKERMLDEKGITWFRKHGPVGCRDQFTLSSMQAAGIDSYLSGCLTSTITNKYNYRTDDIYFVDVLFRVPGWSTTARTPRELLKGVITGDVIRTSKRGNLLKKIFEQELLQKAITLEHYHTARHPEKERFAMAESFLEKYATAKLVVTSRLHCAIPCLAFGTPVIFVDSGFKREYDKCRLDGVTDMFNTICIDDEENISSNFKMGNKIGSDFSVHNPDVFKKYVTVLRNACNTFINS